MPMNRRTALASLSLAAAAATMPGLALSQSPAGRLPRRLKAGDRVGLIAPASFLADRSELELVQDTMRAMQLEPVSAPNILSRYGYLAGTDAERADSTNAMIRDRSLSAIFAVRGGWGCARILPMLDYAAMAAHPKVFAGYSDITAMHLAFAARGLRYPTIHGPVGIAAWPEAAWDAFRALTFEGATPSVTPPVGTADRLVQRDGRIATFTGGRARGRLLGGNLTVLAAMAGTAYLPDFSGAILFLEDIGEAPYRIDRMLTQLRLAGLLDNLAGVAFGQCSDCSGSASALGNFTVDEVLEQHFAPLGIPAFAGAMIGHIGEQTSLPVNAMAEIDADSGAIRMLEPAVS